MAALELTFVDEIPQAKRGKGSRTAGTRAGDGRPMLVTETGDRYVAPDSHRAHGTHVKYVVERCRCVDCTRASREYNRWRRHQTRPAYVDAAPAREHVRAMMRLGYGYEHQADATGVAPQIYQNLLYGGWRRRHTDGARTRRPPAERMRPATVDLILSFRPATVGIPVVDRGSTRRVASLETRRLWAELVARGAWPAWAARESGLDRQFFDQLPNRPVIRATSARKVADLHAAWVGRQIPPKHWKLR